MSTDYSAASWTAAELLADIYRACRLPSSGTQDYTPTVVLGMATSAIHDWGGHIVSTARDGRALADFSRASTDARDVNGNDFELPPLALGDTIDSVVWVDSSGESWPLELIPQAMEHLFDQTGDTGRPTCYAFRDGSIRVFPKPDTSGSLRIKYMRRHGVLVIGSDTTTVTSFASASSTDTNITVASIPSSVVAGAWLDVIGKYHPYRTKMHGLRVVSAASSVVRVSTPLAAFTAASTAGDTLALYGKTPYVQVPLEMREPLTRQISSRILAELGDLQLADGYDKMAIVGAQRVRDVLSPRSKVDRAKLKNPFSLARGGSSRRRRWTGDV